MLLQVISDRAYLSFYLGKSVLEDGFAALIVLKIVPQRQLTWLDVWLRVSGRLNNLGLGASNHDKLVACCSTASLLFVCFLRNMQWVILGIATLLKSSRATHANFALKSPTWPWICHFGLRLCLLCCRLSWQVLVAARSRLSPCVTAWWLEAVVV